MKTHYAMSMFKMDLVECIRLGWCTWCWCCWWALSYNSKNMKILVPHSKNATIQINVANFIFLLLLLLLQFSLDNIMIAFLLLHAYSLTRSLICSFTLRLSVSFSKALPFHIVQLLLNIHGNSFQNRFWCDLINTQISTGTNQ